MLVFVLHTNTTNRLQIISLRSLDFFKSTHDAKNYFIIDPYVFLRELDLFHWFNGITSVLTKTDSRAKARRLQAYLGRQHKPTILKALLHCWYSFPAPAAGALVLKLSMEHSHPSAIHPKSSAWRSLSWLALLFAHSGSCSPLHNEAVPYVYISSSPGKVCIALNHCYLWFIKKGKKYE